MSKKYYITTAIPYVNAPPHIGHALEFIQTDVLARFHRLFGEEVFFLTGTDENAQKNALAAETLGIPTQELVDRNSTIFEKTLSELSISNDGFIRTTDRSRHWEGVKALWNACVKSGDIYKKSYSGLYCVGCEAFVTEKDLVEGKCPEHLKAPEKIVEENYFFRLSKYQKRLEELIETDSLRIVPETRKNEVLSFVREGLEDFSVSRPASRMKGWGIPVPGDEGQVIYVWYDALGNYLTALGFGTNDTSLEKRFWPADLHVIGKGIIRFHAVYWPAMLLSAGVPLPKGIFAHGYITVEGMKMSKSIGNIVSPTAVVQKFGCDPFRYFFMREISPFEDGDYSEALLAERVNNELVANFGNLAYRAMTFSERNFGGKIRRPASFDPKEAQLLRRRKAVSDKVKALVSELRLREALEEIFALSTEGNRHFQENKPWVTIKDRKEECERALFVSLEITRACAVLLQPFIPSSSANCLRMLGAKAKGLVLEDAHSDSEGFFVSGAEILFRKIEPEETGGAKVPAEPKSQKEKKSESKEQVKAKIMEQPSNEKVSIDYFRKVELKVATVLSAERVFGAEKLLKLSLDLGEGAPRTIVSGIYPVYAPEDLAGKQIIIVANLEPAKIRGVESNGMLLAAWDEKMGQLALLHPGKEILPGTRIS